MKYDIHLERVPQGFRASVPALPGCWAEGLTEAHATNRVEAAIGDYLAALDAQMDAEHEDGDEPMITP